MKRAEHKEKYIVYYIVDLNTGEQDSNFFHKLKECKEYAERWKLACPEVNLKIRKMYW